MGEEFIRRAINVKDRQADGQTDKAMALRRDQAIVSDKKTHVRDYQGPHGKSPHHTRQLSENWKISERELQSCSLIPGQKAGKGVRIRKHGHLHLLRHNSFWR